MASRRPNRIAARRLRPRRAPEPEPSRAIRPEASRERAGGRARMKTLWAPWRMTYLEESPSPDCFFCAALASDDDRAHLVLARPSDAIIMLNKYPYGSGHLLVAPRAHVGRPEELPQGAYGALMEAVRRSAEGLRAAFSPEGMNI